MEKEIIQKETHLTTEFVSPKFCAQLHQAGITGKTVYFYILEGDYWRISTFEFDPEGIYKQALTNEIFISPKQVIPAYRISEIEHTLPDYLLSKQNKQYKIILDKLYGDADLTSTRLADLLAQMLLHLIKIKLFTPEYINQGILLKY